ncbi:hypothetical protein Cgig2_016374 [Carnegiea gigantea]|uniref:Uncharacterized protein n=1 Tax=Carnegiea gigantea TaxID=171969 RepID=A0A9Q1JVK4_9CARY|nr:hypothetical protein Cgig2_016374 [Carnegiea gigantea]
MQTGSDRTGPSSHFSFSSHLQTPISILHSISTSHLLLLLAQFLVSPRLALTLYPPSGVCALPYGPDLLCLSSLRDCLELDLLSSPPSGGRRLPPSGVIAYLVEIRGFFDLYLWIRRVLLIKINVNDIFFEKDQASRKDAQGLEEIKNEVNVTEESEESSKKDELELCSTQESSRIEINSGTSVNLGKKIGDILPILEDGTLEILFLLLKMVGNIVISLHHVHHHHYSPSSSSYIVHKLRMCLVSGDFLPVKHSDDM